MMMTRRTTMMKMMWCSVRRTIAALQAKASKITPMLAPPQRPHRTRAARARVGPTQPRSHQPRIRMHPALTNYSRRSCKVTMLSQVLLIKETLQMLEIIIDQWIKTMRVMMAKMEEIWKTIAMEGALSIVETETIIEIDIMKAAAKVGTTTIAIAMVTIVAVMTVDIKNPGTIIGIGIMEMETEVEIIIIGDIIRDETITNKNHTKSSIKIK